MELIERKLIRLKNYDYSQNGAYFITICTNSRLCLFKNILESNTCGYRDNANVIAEKWLLKLEERFLNIKIDKYIVMPNHVHFILIIMSKTSDYAESPLQDIIKWYKTMTTNEYIQGVKRNIFPPFDKHVWQRGYYDHIIRNEQKYQEIWNYIDTNPQKWQDDIYHQP